MTASHHHLIVQLAFVQERVDEVSAGTERFQQNAFLAGVGLLTLADLVWSRFGGPPHDPDKG